MNHLWDMLSNQDRASRTAVVIAVAALLIMRLISLTANELSWDVFGYYLYLPATIIHGDPLLHDTGWVQQAMEQYGTTGTLYQLSTAPDDRTPMYFFLMGMAICYLPFFLVGHAAAWLTGAPMDGFSMPYQAAMAIGAVAYTAIGLWQLRKALRHFLDDRTVAVTLLLLVFGTNLLHFGSAKNLETANFLFCMVSVLLAATIRWHAGEKRRDLLIMAASIALITLIKPSEIVCGILPLAWGIKDRASLRAKLALLARKRTDLLLAMLLGLVIMAPQLLYWHKMTGHFIYDSYKNPGVGLDLGSPHLMEVLFSFRKGWLLYTPLMLLAIAGMVPLYGRARGVFWPVLIYSCLSLYIIASWSEWWYGASYSVRPMITLYPVLAIPLGMMVGKLMGWSAPKRTIAWGMVALLVFLNWFQLWQFRSWVLHPFRTTKDYYFAVFGRTTIPPGAERWLSAEWSFDGTEHMEADDRYRSAVVPLAGPSGTAAMVLDGEHPYAGTWEMPFERMTNGEYVWLQVQAKLRAPAGWSGEPPCIVFEVRRAEGAYGYRTACTSVPATDSTWMLEGRYMTPPIRDVEDIVRVYLWHRGGAPLEVADYTITIHEPLPVK